MTELTPEQGEALARVRRAIDYLVAAWPDQAAPLVATACAAALVNLMQSPGRQNLVDVINQQWQATPFEVTSRKAN